MVQLASAEASLKDLAEKDGLLDLHGPPPEPALDQLELSLAELHGFTGAAGGRILLSFGGELLDVTAGRALYGPRRPYAQLAGRDVTRCLATMSLEPCSLDDIAWKAADDQEEQTLSDWLAKLKAKYPVAGCLVCEPAVEEHSANEGLRQRVGAAVAAIAGGSLEAAPASEPPPAIAAADAAEGGSQRCPISGKEGAGCPMASFMGLGKASSSAAPAAVSGMSTPAPQTGFMAGKSMVASVTRGNAAEESLLYRLCPLHWDDKTMRLLAIVAVASWVTGLLAGWKLQRRLTASSRAAARVSGILIGWNLHRQLMGS